jgi:hypothetical protein
MRGLGTVEVRWRNSSISWSIIRIIYSRAKAIDIVPQSVRCIVGMRHRCGSHHLVVAGTDFPSGRRGIARSGIIGGIEVTLPSRCLEEKWF